MPCDLCANTGYIVVEVPVFADGGYSDVDRIERPCRCNPAPTDADYDDSHVPGSAYDDFHPTTYLYGTE